MANLNSWQKITRIMPGLPFGDGADGNYNSATIPTMLYRSCSGTSGDKTLTLASAGFTNGDLVIIIQMRGTGVGQWEINQVSSGGGTTTLTLKLNKQYTYTDSGASQAQVIKIPRYLNLTLPSGAWGVPTWNGDTGGVFIAAARGAIDLNAVLSINGASASTSSPGTTGGFRGADTDRKQGEGTGGAQGTQSASPNGNGGGGGQGGGSGNAMGGGGGNVSPGSSGNSQPPATPGSGGSNVTSADMVVITLGGGGGSSGIGGLGNPRAGGAGAGIIILIGSNIDISGGGLQAIGGNGGANDDGVSSGGGSGAGGSILLMCQNIILGSVVALAYGGSTPSAGGFGAGGSGGIAIHHSGNISGTTNPSYTNVVDGQMQETSAGLLNLLI